MPVSICLLPLGTCAGNSTPFQYKSSYLLRLRNSGKTSDLLLDAGSSRVTSKEFINPLSLDAIFISHSHLDHSLYIGKLVKFLKEEKRTRALYIYSNKMTWRTIKWLILVANGFRIPDFVKHVSFGLPARKSALTRLDARGKKIVMKLSNDVEVSIESAYAKHKRDTVSLKITCKGDDDFQLVYAPDTSCASKHLVAFARNASFWMLDSTFTKVQIAELYREKGQAPGHSSPYHSGLLCTEANVRVFIIVHYFWERFGPSFGIAVKNAGSDAANGFKGRIIVARDLDLIHLRGDGCSP
ncbi:MAG: MBL fold metallo-hydrolase [Promethearchaeota archaeon]